MADFCNQYFIMSDQALYKPYTSNKEKRKKKEKEIDTESKDPFKGARIPCDKNTRIFMELELSNDYESRPLYVCPDGHIFLETFSKYYKPAYDFMVAIAEPVSRPKYIQEYQINTYSLYTAVSIGLTDTEIVRVLRLLSKCSIDPKLVKLITDTVQTVGKLKLILKNRRYFVQSTELKLLNKVAHKMENYRVLEKNPADTYDPDTGYIIPDDDEFTSIDVAGIGNADQYGSTQRITNELGLDISDLPTNNDTCVRRFEIKEECVSKARQKALSMNIPFSDEYDFRSDDSNPDLELDLRQATAIRPYQEKALSKMFSGGRAKSGIIVLPCGAGKTLVGITAACTVRKSTIVFCDTNVPVDQWNEQFLRWTTIEPQNIITFTSRNKPIIPDKPIVLITTYSIFTTGRAEETKKAIEAITSREWGLMIMDEVQQMVAETYARVIDMIRAHSKLGLTATLVREDDRIIDLNHLIGPRLYEANWIDLSDQGFIARVKCYEIWCKMTGPFYHQYLRKNHLRQRVYSSMNPNKFNAVERLIRFHENRGDKILVFADIIHVLNTYGVCLSKSDDGKFIRPILKGETSQEERSSIFRKFKDPTSKVKCIFISKIGDKAIDLPDANVLIQICSHFGARMQEAQRLGRILRKKQGRTDEFNAFFYTLISEDTREIYFSRKRQRFLIDQGYVYQVIQDQEELERNWPISLNPPLKCDNPEFRDELLRGCNKADDESGKEEEEEFERFV